MRPQTFSALLLISTVLSTIVAGPIEPLMAQSETPSLDDALWWVPADAETLFVARGPFVWKQWKNEDALPTELEKYIRGTMFTLLRIGEAKQSRGLKSRVLLALHSARNFRAPRGLGLMPYEGADIIVLGDEFAKEREAFLKHIAAVTDRRQTIKGHEVFVGEVKSEGHVWIYFVTSPRPKILVFATHQGYLEEVLRRMSSRASARALPDSLPEWAEIDRNAPLFGLRHYQRDSVEDPTSPFGGRRAGNQPDEQAIGIAFSYPGKQKQVWELSYLSDNKDAIGVAKEGFRNGWEKLEIGHVQKKPGVIAIVIQIRKNARDVHSAFFLVSAYFGHGVYL